MGRLLVQLELSRRTHDRDRLGAIISEMKKLASTMEEPEVIALLSKPEPSARMAEFIEATGKKKGNRFPLEFGSWTEAGLLAAREGNLRFATKSETEKFRGEALRRALPQGIADSLSGIGKISRTGPCNRGGRKKAGPVLRDNSRPDVEMRFALRTYSVLISLIFLIPVNLAYADSPKDHAGWWLKNFGTVDRENRDVARAEQIFRRVAEAADKKGAKLPSLKVIKSAGEPWVIAIRDGSIIVSEGAVANCFRNVSNAKGDARLAFILGHELSHLAKDDYWHIAAFDALEGYKSEKGNESRIKSEIIALLEKWGDVKPGRNANEVIRTKELQADEEGLLTMTMAGFEPSLVVGDNTNFFEEWVSLITGRYAYNDATHPSPAQRALFVKARMKPVIDALWLYGFGVRYYQLGRYRDALAFFEAFQNTFSGREVFNNIGLCHYQLALDELASFAPEERIRFKFTTVLDVRTRAQSLRTRGTYISGKFKLHIDTATEMFRQALAKDSSYLPARINLAATYVISGDAADALGAAESALKIEPAQPDALTAKAVALYLVGVSNNTDTTDNALAILREVIRTDPSHAAAWYNLGSIQSERKRNSAALESWKSFVSLEPAGIYADRARKALNVPKEPCRDKSPATLTPPVKLGLVRGEVKKSLERFRKTLFSIGELEGEVYWDDDLKILAINGQIELIEAPIPLVTEEQFLARYGEPLRRLKTTEGSP